MAIAEYELDLDMEILDLRPLTLQEVLDDCDPELVATVAERVNKGIELLDAQRPGWVERLSEKLGLQARFNIVDVNDCVLGMAYGYYEAGLSQLRFTSRQAAGYGFDALDADDNDEWTVLQRVWSYELEKRLGIEHVAIPMDEFEAHLD